MKARIIMAIVAFVVSALIELIPAICNWASEKKQEREQKLRKMDEEAIDVEWCFA